MTLTEATELVSNALKVHGPMTVHKIAAAIGLPPKRTSCLLSRMRLSHQSLIFLHAREARPCGRSINVYAIALDGPEKKRRKKLRTDPVLPSVPKNCNVLGIWTQLISPCERRFFSHPPKTH